MATQDPKTDPEIEEKEEKESPSILSNLVQMIILFWSLAVISYAYFGNSIKQIDTTFAAGLLSAVMSNICLLYTSPSPRDVEESRMPSSA